MPNLTLRNIPKGVYAILRRDARRHRRSLNSEILAALSERAEIARRREEAAKVIPELRKLREDLALKYPNLAESAELIREDRDNR